MFELWVDPESGSDTAPGTAGLPLKTLTRANALMSSISPDDASRIWVAPCDVIVPEPIIWRYSHPEYETHIRGSASTLTKFNGNGLANDLLKVMPTRRGEANNLRFTGFSIRNSLNGIAIAGDRDDEENGWVGNIELRGVYLSQIGSQHASGNYGAGAIRLINCRDSLIRLSQAHYLENSGGNGAYMHAVYAAHHSSNNTVTGNKFSHCAGDPIRTRDQSNKNKFLENEFHRCGDTAVYSDWFCTGASCTKPGGECPSYGNEFKNNTSSRSGYSGATLALFRYYGSATHCGVQPEPRLYTLGNKWV